MMDAKMKALAADAFGVEEADVTQEQYDRYAEIVAKAKAAEEPAEEKAAPAIKTPEKPDPTEELLERIKSLEVENEKASERVTELERGMASGPPRVEVGDETFDITSKSLITEPARAQTINKGRQELIDQFQKFNDDAMFISALMGRGTNIKNTRFWQGNIEKLGHFGEFINSHKGYLTAQDYEQQVPNRKATFTTTTGADWIPTILSSNFYELFRQALTLMPLFVQVPMASKVVELAVEGSTEPVVYKTSEASTVTTGDLVDAKATLTASKLMVRSQYTTELDEDSIVPMLEHHKRRHARRLADAIENTTIHGESSSSYGMASDSTAASYACDQIWDGLQYQANTASTTHSAAGALFDGQDAITMLADLEGGNYLDEGRVGWVVNPLLKHSWALMVDYQATGYRSLVMNPNPVESALIGGPAATMMGFPIIATPNCRRNLNAAGIYDGASTDYTNVFLVNFDTYAFGDRRIITVETDKNITNDVNDIVTSWRGDFAAIYGTSADSTSMTYYVHPTTTGA